MQNPNKVKSQHTEQEYARILRGLDRTADRMSSEGLMTTWPERPIRLTLAFLETESSLAASSARMYRAALDWLLAGDRSDVAFDATALLYPDFSHAAYALAERFKRLMNRPAK